ncbi:hypothetical protein ACF1BU_19870 [Streptomyces sp. NPDC014724]|uniref:hypothetical protein n=1 Tax=unclassified Streptomyces TaxID=2593676 RepID=UPI00370233F2
MRIKIATVVMVGAMGLLVTGCSGGGSGSDDAGTKSAAAFPVLPQKVPKPPTMPEGELQPSPDADAPFSKNLAYELRRKTLDMAKAEGKTVGECPNDVASKAGTHVTCTITYEGLDVVWDVTIGEKSGWSDNVVQYQAVPRKGVLTRDGAARLLYGNYDPELVRCNNIPEAVLVPMNTKTKYTCQTVDKGKPGLVEAARVTDAGPRFY